MENGHWKHTGGGMYLLELTGAVLGAGVTEEFLGAHRVFFGVSRDVTLYYFGVLKRDGHECIGSVCLWTQNGVLESRFDGPWFKNARQAKKVAVALAQSLPDNPGEGTYQKTHTREQIVRGFAGARLSLPKPYMAPPES